VGAWLRTPDRALATFALEGGGELRLDAGTSVRLAGERRLALDRGAIYVDSGTSRGGAPVSIETPAGTVRDVGTRFEVRLLDRVLRVRVREGAVRLERAGVQRDASAGTELTTTPGGAIGERAIPAYDEDWAWTVRAAPSFRVEGRTLETFLDWVSREGGWTVTFADPAIEQSARTTILHGSIEGLTTDEALAVILPACGLTYRIDTGHVVVDRPPPPAGGS
jgi:ferric-dicitrate binding protein FerR (iron transport regulator)